uniref:Bm531 n=1 Tax=Brugia malayi TaxID=6279 RepID=A0A1I9G373_BRUMA|nr:Bm531 [Brugia malayi]
MHFISLRFIWLSFEILFLSEFGWTVNQDLNYLLIEALKLIEFHISYQI